MFMRRGVGGRLTAVIAALLWCVVLGNDNLLGSSGTLQEPAQSKEEAHEIAFTIIDNRPFLDVFVNGHGPFKFLLDSAGSSLISADLVKRLQIKTYGAFVGEGVGENVVHASYCDVKDVQVGNLDFGSQKLITTDLSEVRKAIGFKQFDGIVGRRFFLQGSVTIDFVSHTIVLEQRSSRTIEPEEVKLPLYFIDGLPVVDATAGGVPGKFTLDTGDRWWLTLYAPFVKSHRVLLGHRQGPVMMTGWGAAGAVQARVERLDSLVLGTRRIEDVLVRIPVGRMGAFSRSDISGNIGSGVLRDFKKITFDFRNRAVILQGTPVGTQASRAKFDRSGMWLVEARDGFKVFWLLRGGPAALAGFREGDVVVSVNGIPTKKLFLPDLREQLSENRNDTVSMVVRSERQLISRKIRLKSLVQESSVK